MAQSKFQKPKSLEEFISEGASVLSDQKKHIEWTNFTLRIRKDLSEKIDDAIIDRIGISKTAWILEAIQEKLSTKL